MRSSLNIPFEPSTTRRSPWRVVLIVAVQTLVICAGLLLLSASRRVDTTSRLAPEGTEWTLWIQKTPETTRLIHEHVGSQTVLPGRIWTYDDVLRSSSHNFSIHFSGTTVLGFSVDQPMEAVLTASPISQGLHVFEDGNTTLVTEARTLDQTNDKKTTAINALPWFDGAVRQGDHSFPISLNHTGVSIKGIGQHWPIPPNWSIAADAEVLASWYIEPGTYFQETSRILHLIQQNGAHLLIANDANGLVQMIAIKNNNVTTEQLASIGQELLSTNTLSTTVLTLQDGTPSVEIRTDSTSIETTISAENDVTTIVVRNAQGNFIRIHKTPELVLFANRDISTSDSSPIRSTCEDRALFFVQPAPIKQALVHSTLLTPIWVPTGDVFELFYEISVTSNMGLLCW